MTYNEDGTVTVGNKIESPVEEPEPEVESEPTPEVEIVPHAD